MSKREDELELKDTIREILEIRPDTKDGLIETLIVVLCAHMDEIEVSDWLCKARRDLELEREECDT